MLSSEEAVKLFHNKVIRESRAAETGEDNAIHPQLNDPLKLMYTRATVSERVGILPAVVTRPIMAEFTVGEIVAAVDDKILKGEIRNELPRMLERSFKTENYDELREWAETRIGPGVYFGVSEVSTPHSGEPPEYAMVVNLDRLQALCTGEQQKAGRRL